MVVVRFKIQCQPGKTQEVRAALVAVVEPSRATPGVITFDIAQDITDPNTFIAIEVFEGKDALARQESLPQVAQVLALLPESVAAEPEATIFEVSSSAPWG